MEIIRNVAGMELKITLTEEELRSIVAEFATITFNGTKTKTEPETKKEWKPVKAYTTGVVAQHGDDVIRMYLQGQSCHKIAVHYGVSAITVSRFLRNSGVQMRTPQDANKLRWGKPTAA